MNEFENNLKKALDEKTGALDAATLSRLRQAREKALDAPVPWWRALQARTFATVGPAGIISHGGRATAALSILVLLSMLLFMYMFVSSPGAESTETLEFLEILNLDADLELVEEMDFYHWLEEQTSGESNR